MGVRPRPHLYACGHLANSASLLLPVSNLTNLLAFTAAGLGFGRFAGVMIPLPWPLLAFAAGVTLVMSLAAGVVALRSVRRIEPMSLLR